MNCGPIMQQRQNGGRYSYSSNQDFVNYNHNYLNFRQNNNAQQYQIKNNSQHYQNNQQFHEQGGAAGANGSGNNDYYNNGNDVYLQRFHRAATNNMAAGQGNAHGMNAYNNGGYYNNGGCNNQQCSQQQCSQQHNGYYNGYQGGDKFADDYQRPNTANLHQQDQHQQQQQQQQYYMDLDRKRESEVAAAQVPGTMENISPFQSPPAPQEFDSSNNMVLKDMSTSLSSLYDENTYFQMNHGYPCTNP